MHAEVVVELVVRLLIGKAVGSRVLLRLRVMLMWEFRIGCLRIFKVWNNREVLMLGGRG